MNEGTRQKKVVICGVSGSDNLGDTVIAECIAEFVKQELGQDPIICDISYREGLVSNVLNGKKINTFKRLPKFFRQCFVLILFSLKFIFKGRKYLLKKLKGADFVIVGGGHLISDVDLNFPLKLFFLTTIAEELNLPILIVSVGVGSTWSKLGIALASRLVNSKNVKAIAVRDPLSKQNLVKYFGKGGSTILQDPAMLLSRFFPKGEYITPRRQRVGLGVADLNGLNYSSDIHNLAKDNDLDCWDRLVSSLNEQVQTVILFTNGALEDERFMRKQLVPFLIERKKQFVVQRRFSSGFQLVRFISELDKVIAFRLHANIIATSYNVPSYGINWDQKVESFFILQNRHSAVFESIASLLDSIELIKNQSIALPKLNSETVVLQYLDFFELNSTVKQSTIGPKSLIE